MSDNGEPLPVFSQPQLPDRMGGMMKSQWLICDKTNVKMWQPSTRTIRSCPNCILNSLDTTTYAYAKITWGKPKTPRALRAPTDPRILTTYTRPLTGIQSERTTLVLSVRTVVTPCWLATRTAASLDTRRKYPDKFLDPVKWTILLETWIHVSLTRCTSTANEPILSSKHTCRLVCTRKRTLKEARLTRLEKL